MAGSPLEQFEIKPILDIRIGGFDVSFSNSALFMAIAVGLAALVMIRAARPAAMVPGRGQALAEMLYSFVHDLIRENAGKEALKYFPFVFSIFVFVLFGNLLGMIPYSFTYTSHIIVTFALAMMVFVAVTVIAILRHGTHFFSFFFPHGAPIILAPLLIPIEIISYLSRPVSLSVRLFANMLAGHTMLKVFAGFSVALGVVGGIAPLAVNVALTAFEVLVALLQAYVFTLLTCLYLKDAIELH